MGSAPTGSSHIGCITQWVQNPVWSTRWVISGSDLEYLLCGLHWGGILNDQIKRYEWNNVISRRRPETSLNLPEYWHENPEFGSAPFCRFIHIVLFDLFIRGEGAKVRRKVPKVRGQTYKISGTLPRSYFEFFGVFNTKNARSVRGSVRTFPPDIVPSSLFH
jgi:hypothetical protein